MCLPMSQIPRVAKRPPRADHSRVIRLCTSALGHYIRMRDQSVPVTHLHESSLKIFSACVVEPSCYG
jgi:hypothetical protein